jgi:hypothetical protein
MAGLGPAIHAFDASKRRQGRRKAETIVFLSWAFVAGKGEVGLVAEAARRGLPAQGRP